MSRKKTVKKCMWWLLIFVLIAEAIPIPADAGLLVQSDEKLTQDLYHEHGGSDSACYGRVFKECGGFFFQIAEGSEFYCCSKCRLYMRGKPENMIHSGEYTEGLVCDEDLIGSFYIERSERADGVFLMAGIEGGSGLISEYEISWNEEGAYTDGLTSVMPVTVPGTYHAHLRYHDGKAGAWREASLDYTDLSVPCKVSFYSEGNLLGEVEMPYGSSFAAIELPERYGYDFGGFYAGAGRYYDEAGQPAELGVQPLETAFLELTADWSAKRFPFRYGPDADGDGLGDGEAVLIYDQAPPAIALPEAEERPGFELDGYYIGEKKLYDAQGAALGVWTEVPAELPLRLEERWKERFYTLHYDLDHDGVKEASAILRYGESLPQLQRPGDIPGMVFDGYFYDERKIFDADGRPAAALPELFELGSISLKDEWHIKHFVISYGPDEDGDGEPDFSIELDYGETPPAVEMPVPAPRKGYEFDGYAVDGEKIYDRDGRPAGAWRPDMEEGSYELEPLWKAKEYRLYYGPDSDGDGIPDLILILRYDSVPPAISLPEPQARPGYVFDGYYVGDRQLFGPDGQPTGPWNADPEGDGKLILKERFRQVSITIFFGPDLNGDGRPDQYRTIRYGDPMPLLDLGEVKERKGYRFLGYYVGETMLYDAMGVPATENCTFTTQAGSYILSAKWEAKSYALRYGTDEDGDGVPDRELQVTYGQPYQAVEVPKLEEGHIFDGYYLDGEMVYDPEGKPKELWIWDSETDVLELKSHMLPPNKPEDDKEKGKGDNGGRGANNGSDSGSDDQDGAGEAQGDEGEAGTENGDGADDGSDPGSSVSGNSVSENTPEDRRKKGNGGGKKVLDTAGTEEGGLTEEADPGNDELTDRPVIGEEDIQEEEEQSEAPSAEAGEKKEEPESGDEDLLPALSEAEEKPNEKRDSGAMPIIKKAAAVGAVTVGSLGGILGIYAGLVYLLAMAEVETICPDGRKKRLGRLAIHSEKGKAFLIRLPREMLEQCETDRICLRIPALFAIRYRKRSIVIQTRIRIQEKQIAREIHVEI